MANAHSFMVKVCTPIDSAASSSSRTAAHARPTRERLRRTLTMMASRIAASTT